ncbi:nucleotide cyclase [Hyaloraphidium curvatum]|nr:nucleotide cyclase [Hyaloraphidium curvatum]
MGDTPGSPFLSTGGLFDGDGKTSSGTLTPGPASEPGGRRPSDRAPLGFNGTNGPVGPAGQAANGAVPMSGTKMGSQGRSGAPPAVSAKDIAYLLERLNAQDGGDDDMVSSVAGSSGLGHFESNDELARFKEFQVLLDAFCDAATVPVMITDGEGHVRSINHEALSLFGYERRNIVGKNINMLMPKSLAVKHDYYMQRYHSTKIKHIMMDKQTHLKAVKADGTTFPISLKINELAHPGGTGSSFVGFVQDLTAQLEYERIERTFYSLLPRHIADRMRRGDQSIAEQTAASVLFIDCVDFTAFANSTPASEVIELLTRVFRAADIAAKHYGIEKVKTIGDCYMGACFLLQQAGSRSGAKRPAGQDSSHFMDAPVRAVEMCLDVLQYIQQNEEVRVRVGIATGAVVAGCMEGDRPTYDLLGPTVNLASRLQHMAPINGIAVDTATAEQCSHVFQWASPVRHDIKGCGDVDVFVLEGRKQSSGAKGRASSLA